MRLFQKKDELAAANKSYIYKAIIIQSFKKQCYLLKGTIWVKTKTSQLND